MEIQETKFVCIFSYLYREKCTLARILRDLCSDLKPIQRKAVQKTNYSVFLGAQIIPRDSKLLHRHHFERCFAGEGGGCFIAKLAASGANCMEGTAEGMESNSGRLSAYL